MSEKTLMQSKFSQITQLKEKIKAVLNNAHISHEVEKLQLQERHQEEISELLKELADEKTARVQEAQLALRYLQEQDAHWVLATLA